VATATRDAHSLITCPAGEGVNDTIRGPACRCKIVHETITRDENSGSLKKFCAGDYKACPIWQRMRDAERNHTAGQLEREIARSDPGQVRPR
jgi:hypothetical protein